MNESNENNEIKDIKNEIKEELVDNKNENKRELVLENKENKENEELKIPIKKVKREMTEAQKGNLAKANAQRNINQQYRKILDEQKTKTIIEIENIYKEKLDYFKKIKEYPIPIQPIEMAKPIIPVEEKKQNVTIETKVVEEPIKVEEKEIPKPKNKNNKKVIIKEPVIEKSESENSDESESEDSEDSESEDSSSSEEEIKYHSKKSKKLKSKNHKSKKDKKSYKTTSNSKPLVFSYGSNGNYTFGGRKK